MSDANDKFKHLMPAVAAKYLGAPNQSRSKPGVELRYGDSGAMSICLVEGLFTCHNPAKFPGIENGNGKPGGGVKDLIQYFDTTGRTVADILEQDFGLAKEQRPPLLTLPQAPRRMDTIVFDYCDEDGVVRYQVVRENMSDGTKRIFQKQPAQDGKAVSNVQGVVPLPYNLPRILKKPGALFIVEGEKCVDAMTKADILATTNSGGASKWRPELNHWFQGREVVILPDNDAAGEAHATQVATQLQGIAAAIHILRLEGLPPKGDVADWLNVPGNDGVGLKQLAYASLPWTPGLPPVEHPADTSVADLVAQGKLFELIHIDDLPEVETRWLVKDILPFGGFHNLFGPSSSYKSFVAFYLAVMIATGQQAFGKDTTQGSVVYVAGEGKTGFLARRNALFSQYSIAQGSPIHVLSDQVNLQSTADDAKKLVATIQALQIQPVLIVIDTLNRSFGGGNENNSDDMGRFMGIITAIQQGLNTAVMIVHHTGKDETKGARGHSSLYAAIDAEIQVTKLNGLGDDDRRGTIKVTKQKDSEDGQEFHYGLDLIQTKPGNLVTGKDAVTSLVVVPKDAVASTKASAGASSVKLTKNEKRLLEAFDAVMNDGEGEVVTHSLIPFGTKTIGVGTWREFFITKSPTKSESARDTFKRVADDLADKKVISVVNQRAWRTAGKPGDSEKNRQNR